MKKLTSLLLMIATLNTAFGDCDWNTGITPGPNHTFIYSDACHLKVGQLVQTNKIQATQIADLTKAVNLKDLAIQNSDARVALWQTSADNNFDRLTKIESEQKHNDTLYFVLGLATAVGTGFAISRLYK